jgi:hypothetical protein
MHKIIYSKIEFDAIELRKILWFACVKTTKNEKENMIKAPKTHFGAGNFAVKT